MRSQRVCGRQHFCMFVLREGGSREIERVVVLLVACGFAFEFLEATQPPNCLLIPNNNVTIF